ncbi:MAG: hypothetical protein KME64_03495 [Scytonematopsis contorta HA4267-MV1]|jgi:hypothetical protein|nr:hypothetical protein [Scytonematopsis contorta HA4267-MV1]
MRLLGTLPPASLTESCHASICCFDARKLGVTGVNEIDYESGRAREILLLVPSRTDT